jgi:hypothetical protein
MFNDTTFVRNNTLTPPVRTVETERLVEQVRRVAQFGSPLPGEIISIWISVVGTGSTVPPARWTVGQPNLTFHGRVENATDVEWSQATASKLSEIKKALAAMRVIANLRANLLPYPSEISQKVLTNDLTAEARRAIRSVPNKEIAERADQLIDGIESSLSKYPEGNLAPLDAYELDDGSVMVEWVLDNARLGFSVKLDDKRSGWFLVTDDPASEVNSLGYLNQTDVDSLVQRLVNTQR